MVTAMKLSKKCEVLMQSKLNETVQMEKDLIMVKKASNDGITSDERLMKLSAKVRSYARDAILLQFWTSSRYGVLRFILFTFIGCAMLYGGYLLNVNPLIKEGDIFVVVLSVALIASEISDIIRHYHAVNKGVAAALQIRNLAQSDHEFTFLRKDNKDCPTDQITITLITAPELARRIVPSKNCYSSLPFITCTKNVLRNYNYHKIFLILSLVLAFAAGLEQPSYNIIMERIFTAILGNTSDIQLLIRCAIALSIIGFSTLLTRTASAVLAAVASEYMAVSFRVILARYYLKSSATDHYSKSEIEALVDKNQSLTTEAKSLYHPHLTQLIIRLTSLIVNITIGFISSWEISLLGLVIIVFCFCAQIEMQFQCLHHYCDFSDTQFIKKKNKSVKACRDYVYKAASLSIVQTSVLILKAVCYALTAYICNHGYKHQSQAFLSVITLSSAVQEVVLLPKLFKKLHKSWKSLDQTFACMHTESFKNLPSIQSNFKS
ncbi:unnamed protein product [Thelazia callipaeda]|uniref:ABC transmembrane type-1 domain-containing protein n=1 Tax=Thelazia callipaeda TaxID=103827 RepID=A0A158RC52_THECL|nr:unnamed protein product [Thelazia callipaeda]